MTERVTWIRSHVPMGIIALQAGWLTFYWRTIVDMIRFRSTSNRNPATRSLFGEGVSRDLIIVVDTETVALNSTASGDLALLTGLLEQDGVSTLRYADGGPPSGAPRQDKEFFGSAAIGWIQVTPDEPGDVLRTHGVVWSDGTNLNEGALAGDTVPAIAVQLAQRRGHETSFESTPDAVLVAAADAVGADILISERRGVAGLDSQFARGLTVSTVADAIALIGLFLRSRGNYLEALAKGITIKASRTAFFEHSSALFLPHSEEVTDLVRAVSVERNESAIRDLAAASLRRMGRSLQRRDEVWRLASQVPNADVAEDMSSALEAMLAALMGAVDATSRLIHVLYGLPGQLHTSGWQKKQWQKDLRQSTPTIWSAVFEPASHPASIDVLRLLRNTVHAEGLSAVDVRTSGRVVATWFLLPLADGETIVRQAEMVAPLRAWGIFRSSDGSYAADPAVLSDRLIPAIFRMLAAVQEVLAGDLRDGIPEVPVRQSPRLGGPAIASSHLKLIGMTPRSTV
ncbi:hypothetical protein GCM10025780_05680 [Frondihabitans cladoniiphilus]|uniref:Uncharacterized protein n=2 Tax=Frondihabitans cladoniiphilus TaxID=715785 RepID=A0ABP8VL47_9MICO